MTTAVMAQSRPCPKCGVIVDLTPSRRKHGRYICNTCSNDRTKTWIAANEERAALASSKRTRRWQLNNPDKLPSKEAKRTYDRQHFIRKKYGLTLAEYDALLAQQNNSCAICEGEAGGRHNVFHIDHDHATGRVRGLLCAKCNLAIGSLGQVRLLQRAIEYIGR